MFIGHEISWITAGLVFISSRIMSLCSCMLYLPGEGPTGKEIVTLQCNGAMLCGLRSLTQCRIAYEILKSLDFIVDFTVDSESWTRFLPVIHAVNHKI